jgi:hypothetical protein
MIDETQQADRPMTFLEKIEVSFEETKTWLIKEFGDHMSIHNAVGNLKTEVISHVADHFADAPAGVEVGNSAPVKAAEDSTNYSSQQSTEAGVPVVGNSEQSPT